MILDPHLITSIAAVTAAEIAVSFLNLYPDMGPLDEGDMQDVERWLAKARRRPGTALSTGRRNSMRGMFTCCLLDVLKVPLPRSARDRMTMAWAILNSENGAALVGSVPELEVARAEWKQRCGAKPLKEGWASNPLTTNANQNQQA